MRLAELFDHWTERDHRYSVRRKNGVTYPLTPEEVSSIRSFRLDETRDLGEDDRRLGQMALERWSPPEVNLR